MVFFLEGGWLTRLAFLVFVGAMGYAVYCQARARRHRAPGVRESDLLANWREADYRYYAPEGQRWVERGLRAWAVAIIALFTTVALAVAGL